MSLIDVDALMAKVAATTPETQPRTLAKLAIVARPAVLPSQPSHPSQRAYPGKCTTPAEALCTAHTAESMHRESDHRVMCVDCCYLRRGRCLRHHQAGLTNAVVGPELAMLPQSCAAYQHIASSGEKQ